MEHRDNIVVLNQQKFANSPVKYFTASFLLGDRFRNLEGEQIGEIKAIRLNFSEGPMGYTVIQFSGLQFRAKNIRFTRLAPFSDPVKKGFILDRRKASLGKITWIK